MVASHTSQQSTQSTIPNCEKQAIDDTTGSQICLKCFTGYYSLEGSRSCGQCERGCVACSESASRCSSCSAGYFLQGAAPARCVQCGEGCGRCATSDTCDLCVDGFFKPAAQTETLVCGRCTAGCKLCRTADVCFECQAGLIRSEVNGGIGCKQNGMGVFLIALIVLITICAVGCGVWALCAFCFVKNTVIIEERSSFAEVRPTVFLEDHTETYY